MNRERRKTYRVALRPCERLLITLHRQRGLPLLGDVVDLSIEGAGAVFSKKPPQLALGERVRLTLATRGGPCTIEQAALVASRSEEGDGRRYGFEFLDRTALEQGLGQRLFRLFNRRGQVRVCMDGAPAAARAERGAICAVGLFDLSAGGLALSIPLQAHAELGRAERLLVRFRLPGEEQALQVVATVQNRRPTPEGLIYGLALDPQETRNFQEVEGHIARFLWRREAEEFARV